MKWLILIHGDMKEEMSELSLMGAAGRDDWINLIYTLLAKWYEQRPRDRKCGLWGIVNRSGKLEQRLPRDMKILWIKGGRKAAHRSPWAQAVPGMVRSHWTEKRNDDAGRATQETDTAMVPACGPSSSPYLGHSPDSTRVFCFLSIYYLFLWFAQGTENYIQVITHQFNNYLCDIFITNALL